MNVTVIFDQGEQQTFALDDGSRTEHLKYAIYDNADSPRKGTLPANQTIYTTEYTYGDADALADGETYYCRGQSDPIPIPGADGTDVRDVAIQNRTITVYVEFQDGTVLTWTMEEQSVVLDLKERVIAEPASPMQNQPLDRVRIISLGEDVDDNENLVNLRRYFPLLRLVAADDPGEDLQFQMD